MSISMRVGAYLDNQNIKYDTLSHVHTNSSIGSAVSSQIPPQKIAKAVVLEDHEGRHLMAVLPAGNKISLRKLGEEMSRSLHLVKESDVYGMFSDCEQGAIPPIGQAYNMEVVFDDTLIKSQGDVYFEGGDHKTLIHMTNDNFNQLLTDNKHLRFSSAA